MLINIHFSHRTRKEDQQRPVPGTRKTKSPRNMTARQQQRSAAKGLFCLTYQILETTLKCQNLLRKRKRKAHQIRETRQRKFLKDRDQLLRFLNYNVDRNCMYCMLIF